jgi:hypothetical protein
MKPDSENQIKGSAARPAVFKRSIDRANLRRKWSTIPKQQYFHNQPSRFTVCRLFVSRSSRLSEVACLLVRLDHRACCIENVNHSIV